ncbi:hypothetical protein PSm6_39310 [Pseudomonas solani]|uniref:Uncharacterized protein n=1 Tax=Pseudomonas solani TaxID=2731552 RepID=A0ABN6BUG8_9PSED|nr:hypothetical protein PSm6_39310 [Pseudomonas solani]
MDRQYDQLQTTLAYHLDLYIDFTANNRCPALIAPENKFRAYDACSVGKRVAESLKTGELQLTLEGYAAICHLARIDVRWNRPIQHRRDILGMHLSPVKTNSALSATWQGL